MLYYVTAYKFSIDVITDAFSCNMYFCIPSHKNTSFSVVCIFYSLQLHYNLLHSLHFNYKYVLYNLHVHKFVFDWPVCHTIDRVCT